MVIAGLSSVKNYIIFLPDICVGRNSRKNYAKIFYALEDKIISAHVPHKKNMCGMKKLYSAEVRKF